MKIKFYLELRSERVLSIGHSFNYLIRIRIFIVKTYVIYKDNVNKFWNTHSGNWQWLAEKPVPVAELNRSLWKASVPSLSFHLMLSLSTIIATLGLIANSVAIIIGAMIIAPLMGPIIGTAYSIVVANRRLLRRSSLTILTGATLTIVSAFIISSFLGLKTVNSEILARTNPTLIDLVIAIAAGAAGSFANSRSRIADALPGVAIAVALVPPLSVVGIGLAWGQQNLSIGALLLFLTNLAGIIFSGSLIFLFQSYGTIARAKRGLFVSSLIMVMLGLPLGFALEQLLVTESVRRSVEKLIRQRTVTFSQADIRSIQVDSQDNILFIQIEVAAPLEAITTDRVGLVRDFIARELKKPVSLTVRRIPVDLFEAPVFDKGSSKLD